MDLQLAGVEGKTDSNYVPQTTEEHMERICLCVYVYVAPPMMWVHDQWQWCYVTFKFMN